MQRFFRTCSLIVFCLGFLLFQNPAGVLSSAERSRLLSPNIILSIFDHCCDGRWFSGGLQQQEVELPCPGNESDDRGFARPLGPNFTLETDQPAERSIQTHPRWVPDGYIYGSYDLHNLGIDLQTGDRFVSEVGFLKGADAGEVRFSLWYDSKPEQAGGETMLVERDDTHDGKLRDINVDLSGYSGRAGALILRVDAKGSSAQDWAVWINPRIERQATPTSIVTQTLAPTFTPSPTITLTPEPTLTPPPEAVQGPSIQISMLPQDPKLTDRVKIRVEALDPLGVALIKIYVNGDPAKTCQGTETCEYTTPPLGEGLEVGAVAANWQGGVGVMGLVPEAIAPKIGEPWWWEDEDEDGVINIADNCVSDPNPDQLDSDMDGVGDVCDTCDASRACESIWTDEVLSPEYCCQACFISDSEPFGFQDGTLYTQLWYDIVSQSGCGCMDTDRGTNPFEQGSVYEENVISRIYEGMPSGPHPVPDRCQALSRCEFHMEDQCTNDTQLREFYCDSDGVGSTLIDCPEGCADGVCVCPDSDGGSDYYTPGTVAGLSDVCLDETHLREYVCRIEDGSIVAHPVDVTCPFSCDAGACVCGESDDGRDPFQRGEILDDPSERVDRCICLNGECGETLLEYTCEAGEVTSEWLDCFPGCNEGACACEDSDGGIEVFVRGTTPYYAPRVGTGSGTSGASDYCLDETTLREFFVRYEGEGVCMIYFVDIPCPGSCNSDFGRCEPTCTDGVQNQGEEGVDCGGSCPASCIDCQTPEGWYLGGGSEAGRFSFDDPAVAEVAWEALMEYADCLRSPECRNLLDYKIFMEDYSEVDALELSRFEDAKMEAVAFYVNNHMGYLYDNGDPENQSAGWTIHNSGRRGCTTKWTAIRTDVSGTYAEASVVADYCGDCEDHAILREALMRYLGISADCAYCADHYNGYWGGGHTFNIVLYRGKWRIMDYHTLGHYFTEYWGPHVPQNVWNDQYGVFWCPDWKDNVAGPSGCDKTSPKRTWNYQGGERCPSSWEGEETYNTNVCP